jgi:flagellar biosynthesis/type III secretory pathway protein FliH
MRAALAQAREVREEVNALREAKVQLEAQMREDKKAYRKLEEDRIYQASQLSSAQGRVHLAEESNTSLRQSFGGLKTKILILKTELATAKAEARASREECARMRALR